MNLAYGAFLSARRSVGEQRSAVSHSMCSVARGAHPTAKLGRSARVRKTATTLLVALSPLLGCRTGEIVSDSQALDDGRRWLDPRTIPAPTAPVLLRAAAANARNQTAVSERLLLDVVQKQPASESARRAYELLSRIYLRSGQYRRLIANLDEWAGHFPNGDDVRKEKADVEQFRRLPDQINGGRRGATVPHTQVERVATKDTTSVTGAGGTAVIGSLTLPEVTFGIVGALVALRPAHVTMQEKPALGGRCCVGNIGLDLLLQTGEVAIDFSTMTLRLR
jgi:hypothetical protein